MDKYSDIQMAVISFSRDSDIGLLKQFLKKGYKHCAIHLLINGVWISIDPLLSGLKILVHDVRASFDMASHLKRAGYDIITLHNVKPAQNTKIRWSIFTCVEVIKRILNIHHFFIITPDQLWRYLNQSQ